MITRLLCAALLAAAFGSASAQTVWRCGPEGRSYSDEPCAGGRAVQVADSRSAEQIQAAKRVADSDARLAQAMVREREVREAKARPLAAAGIGPSAAERALKPRREAQASPRSPKSAKSAKQRSPAADGTSPSAVRAIR